MEELTEIGDGRLSKKEKDWTEETKTVISEAEQLYKTNLRNALDKLYIIEKHTRNDADMKNNALLQVAIVQLCFNSKDWTALNENIIMLSKKRSLLKQAVTKMVQEAVTYVDQTPNEEARLKLIDTLRTVTAGKIYVEVERARLTKDLAKKKESEGNVDEATTLMLDLQIETYGSMEKNEKVEFLLEQMRLCLARKDSTRAQIISRKISPKFFDDLGNEIQLQKLKFYRQMIELDQYESNYLSICNHFLAIYNTPIVQQDRDKLQEALKNVAIYILLAPHDNTQWDLLNRIKLDKNLENILPYRELLELFSINEVINWNKTIVQNYEVILTKGTNALPATGVFDGSESGKKHWADLKTRVVEHNIRMVSKYYTRVTVKRLSQLLEWPENSTEEFLCKMIVDGTLAGAKIDRPTGIVSFHPKQSPTEFLDEWSSNVNKLMNLLNKCSHLILKEEMVHKHLHVEGAK